MSNTAQRLAIGLAVVAIAIASTAPRGEARVISGSGDPRREIELMLELESRPEVLEISSALVCQEDEIAIAVDYRDPRGIEDPRGVSRLCISADDYREQVREELLEELRGESTA